MRVGSLFSGIGGFDLGLERAGMSVSWQVENNDYCRKVLAKHWPTVPCYGDIKTVKWEEVEPVDLVCGGFPCQPFSFAGKRRGQADDRYLWPEVARCLATLRPTWFLGENVPGLINLALDQVCADLESLGYTVWPVCLPACAVDAPHQRQRIWIVAYTERNGSGPRRTEREGQQWQTSSLGDSGHVADTDKQPTGRSTKPRRQRCEWAAEPAVGGSSDGLPDWLDRHIGKGMSYAESQRAIETLRALWKPHVAAAIWQAAGGLDRISQAEVLFALVREYKKDAHQARLLLASPEALEAFVRGVWRATAEAGSSHRSRQVKQRSVEHPDPLQVVSQLPSCDTKTPWPVLGWEDGIVRVASGVERRVDRLRGLGNAIVPQIAEEIGKMILAAVADDEDYSDLL